MSRDTHQKSKSGFRAQLIVSFTRTWTQKSGAFFFARKNNTRVNKLGSSKSKLSVSIRKTGVLVASVLLVPVVTLSFVLLPSNRDDVEAAAGIRETIHFQARLLSDTGSLVSDGNYNIQFQIYSGGDGDPGTADETNEWIGSFMNNNSDGITVKNGYISAELGTSTQQTGTIGGIDWNDDTLWLSINIGDTGSGATCDTEANFNSNCGGDGEMDPMMRLTSVPYALNAGNLDGLDSSEFVQIGQGTTQTDSSSNTTIDINKTGTGNILRVQDGGTTVFTIGNTGTFTVQNSSDSATSFQVNQADGDNVFIVDTTNGQVELGDSTLAGELVISDGSSNTVTISTASLSANATYQFANAASGTYEICTTASVCAGYGASSPTLQVAYANGNTITTTTARDIEFDLADTATDSSFIVDIQGTGNTFEVQDGGTSVLTVADGGAITIAGDTTFSAGYQLFVDDGDATNPGIAFQNDTNTGIYGNGSDTISFTTGGANRLTLANSSATFASGVDLTVNGNATFQNDTDSTSGFQILDQDGGTSILNVDTTNERVGIGTDTPTVKFQVVDSSTSTTGATEYGTRISFTDTGVVSSGTDTTYGLDVSTVRTGASGGTIDTYGISGSAQGDTGGASTAIGVVGSAYGADTNIGVRGLSFITNGQTVTDIKGLDASAGTWIGVASGSATNAISIDSKVDMANGSGTTFTNGFGLRIQSADAGSNTLTNNYGILVQDQTAGGSDYGIAIAGADTYALWIGSGADNTDAANGITFGASGDTNLYRSAADTLRTDDAFYAGGIITAATLGTADSDTLLCRNTSNQIATCSSTFDSSVTLQDAYQNGNTITATDAEGDIDLTVSEATNFSVDITGTGSFLVQDSGTNILSVVDGGAVSISNPDGTDVALTVNGGTSTGNILDIQDNGSSVFTIADGGDITTTGSITFSSGQGFDWAGTQNDIWANTGTGVLTTRAVNEVILRVGATSILSADSSGVDITGAVSSTGGYTFSGVATDITTGTNEDLTVVANGTGEIVLNDTVQVATLGSADTATYVCRNSSNQLATCNTTGAGAAFVQGGNNFGATAVLGTNDAYGLTLEVGGNSAVTIADGGATSFQNETDSTSGFSISDADGGTTIFNVDTTNERVGIGVDAPINKLEVQGSANVTGTGTVQLTGTIDPAASTAVVGVGTAFTTELKIGDRIVVSGETRIVTDITDDENLTVNTAFSNNGNDATPDKISSIFTAYDVSGNPELIVSDDGVSAITALQVGDPAYVLDASTCNFILNTSTCDVALEAINLYTGSTINAGGVRNILGVQADATNAQSNYATYNLYATLGTQNYTGENVGSYSGFNHSGSGTVTLGRASYNGIQATSSGTITTAIVNDNVVSLSDSSNITTAYGIRVQTPDDTSSGSIGTNYGIFVADQTGSSTADYGIAIAGADTQALWIGSGGDNTDSANGIAFGSSRDTNLYRSAANTLRTDDSFVIDTVTDSQAAFSVSGDAGQVLRVDSVDDVVYLGASGLAGTLGIWDGSSNTISIRSGNQTGDYIVSLPTNIGQNDTFCLLTENNCNIDTSVTLQDAYQNGNTITATDAEGDIDLTVSEATNFSVDITGTGSFLVQDGGTAVLTVADGGAATFQNTTDSTTGFQVLDADGGTSILNVDTTNERVGIGVDDPDSKLEVVGSVGTSGGQVLNIGATGTSTTTATYGTLSTITANPGGAAANWFYGVQGAATSSSSNLTGASLAGVSGGTNYTGTGTVDELYGVVGQNFNTSTGTINTAAALYAMNASNSGTITENYGLLVQDQTAGSSDYGIAIAGADTYALWVGSGADNTDAANGITFGASGDTNLYRSAANVLRTDDQLRIGSGTPTDIDGVGDLYVTDDVEIGGRILANTGSNSAPTFTFWNDEDTGLYRVAAEALGITTSGTLSWQFAGDDLLPGAASQADIGSTSAEVKSLYLADNTGINFGLDQNVLIAYDELTDDRLEVTGAAVNFQNATDSTSGFSVSDADGGTTVFNVDTTNERVGIGVDDPAYALEVNGNVQVSSGVVGPTFRWFDNSDSDYFSASFNRANDDLRFSSNTVTDILTINDVGTIGINDPTPGATLRVVDVVGTTIDTLQVDNATSTGDILELQDNGTAVARVADGGAATFQNSTDSTSGFRVLDADGGTSILNVDTTNERVGIGTDTPNSKLQVVETSTSTTAASWRGLQFDVTDTGVVSTGTDETFGLDLNVTRTGATGGTISSYGIQATAVGDTGGTSTTTGVSGVASSADTNYGVAGLGLHVGTDTGIDVYGVGGGVSTWSNSTAGTINNGIALSGSINLTEGSGVTLTNGYGLRIQSANAGSNTLTNNYGILVQDQTAGGSDYGIAIAGADTYALWVGSGADNTDAANGITFGSSGDTNLYRSAADTLRTDDAFYAGGIITAASLGTADSDTLLCRNSSNQIATCSSTFDPSVTLQDAYANGNTITATDAEGDIDLTVSEATNFSVDITGTGSFLVQDGGSNVLEVADGGTTTITNADGSDVALTVNGGTSTGNILELQDGGTTVFDVSSNGRLDISPTGLTTGNNIINAAAGTVTGNIDGLRIEGTVSGNLDNLVQNSGAGRARQVLRVLGAGDANTLYQINGGQNWSVGLDNSDSDSFKISGGSALGTNDYLTITTAGASSFSNPDGSDVALTVNGGTSTGNILNIQDNGTNVLTVADGGAAVFQNTTDSTSGFQILDADGGTSILNVDTTNERVGIGIDTPETELDVVGDAQVSSKLQVGDDTAGTINQCLSIIGLITCDVALDVLGESTQTTTNSYGNYTVLTVEPGAENTAANVASSSQLITSNAGSQDFSGLNIAIDAKAWGGTTGTISSLYGVNSTVQNAVAGTITDAVGVNTSINQSAAGTITTGTGLRVTSPTISSGTLSTYYGVDVQDGDGTNNYGIIVRNQTGGSSSNYGLVIEDAGTYSLWLQSDDNNQAGGITFRSNGDTNLYSSAANTLRTDDTLSVGTAIISQGTLTLDGVATDITTDTNEDLTLVANGTGEIILNDSTDIGSATTGINVATTGAISDIDGNLVLNDQVDIGSATTGLRVATTGSLSDIDGNVVIADTIDLGSATTGLRIQTTGVISDIDGNIVLNDQTDIGSATTGIRVTTAGVISDIDGNIVLGDVVDIGSATTGLNVTTAGVITDIDGNVVIADTIDLGSASTGLNVTTAGVISDIDGDVSINDNLVVTGNVSPSAASTYDLGTTSAEWRSLYLADNTGINFGLDQDVLIAYDETTDNRLEISGTNADVWIEDDLTVASQLAVGSTSSITAREVVSINEDYTSTSGVDVGISSTITASPSANSTGQIRGIDNTVEYADGNTYDLAAITADRNVTSLQGDGAVTIAYGGYNYVKYEAASAAGSLTYGYGAVGQVDNDSGNTIANAVGVVGVSKNTAAGAITLNTGVSATASNEGTGNITDNYGLFVLNSLTSSGNITNNYGLYVNDIDDTGGGSVTGVNAGLYVANIDSGGDENYGLYVTDAEDASIYLASTDGDAASGILFGGDTTLYRSGANELTTDDSLVVTTKFNTTNAANNGFGTSGTASTQLTVVTGGDTRAGLLVRANSASQSGDLFQVKDSSSNDLFIIDADGDVTFGNTGNQTNLVLNDGSSNTVTLQTAALTANATYQFADASTGTYEICTTAAVCSGYASTTSTTLQGAYANGNTITATDAEGDIDLTVSEATNFSVDITGTGSFLVQDGGTNILEVDSDGGVAIGKDANPNAIDNSALYFCLIGYCETTSESTSATLIVENEVTDITGIAGLDEFTIGIQNVLSVDPDADDTNGKAVGIASTADIVSSNSDSMGFLYGSEINARSQGTGNLTLLIGNSFSALNNNTSGTVSVGAGSYGGYIVQGGGNTTTAYGVLGQTQLAALSSGNITTAYGGYFQVTDSGSGSITTGYGLRVEDVQSATTAYGLYVNDLDSATTNYGLYVDYNATGGGTDYGLTIVDADTASIWLQSDGADAASGISFGSTRDTVIYRSASNTLYTPDALTVNGQVILNTATETIPLCIGRTAASCSTEALTIGVDDANAVFRINQDEDSALFGGYRFYLDGDTGAGGDFEIWRDTTFLAEFNETGNILFGENDDKQIYVQTRTSDAAGRGLTLIAGQGGAGSGQAGGLLTLQGGAAGGTNANGGNVLLSGGAGAGTGVNGLVVLDTPAFSSTIDSTCGTNCTITQSVVDGNGSVVVEATASGLEIIVPDPSITTAGRILYVTIADGSNDLTLTLNDGAAAEVNIGIRENETATLVWNGSDWTAAGASSSTTLQSAYNNTLTSAGGAELILNAPGGDADGLTIRNNETTPITGGLLEVQSSIGNNLFAVNNYGTEYTANGGAENSTTFATNWTLVGSSTIARTVTSGEYATGQAAVDVVTTAAANDGVRNNLATALSTSTTYQVSFTGKLDSGTFTTLDVQYSPDGGSTLVACTNYSTQTLVTGDWTKVTCDLTTDGTAVTDSDLIIRQTDATARTFWVDNVSVRENSSSSTPPNVQIGGGQNGGAVTLFTLDQASSPPVASGDSTYYGSMYYDTVTGRIQCYEADGWGACGSPPNNIITITPEYAGAVLNGTGVGTMSADFCSNETGVLEINSSLCDTGEAVNFYEWTSPQATDQTYSIYLTFQLPTTFESFLDNNTITLDARSTDHTAADVTYEVFRSTGSAITECGSDTTVTTATDTWQTVAHSGDEFDGCSFAAGDRVIFKLNMIAKDNESVYVSDINFTYTNQ